jgi:hypothetical protein
MRVPLSRSGARFYLRARLENSASMSKLLAMKLGIQGSDVVPPAVRQPQPPPPSLGCSPAAGSGSAADVVPAAPLGASPAPPAPPVPPAPPAPPVSLGST